MSLELMENESFGIKQKDKQMSDEISKRRWGRIKDKGEGGSGRGEARGLGGTRKGRRSKGTGAGSGEEKKAT